MPIDEKDLFDQLKEANAKLIKPWEQIPENPVVVERRGIYNALTGEIEE